MSLCCKREYMSLCSIPRVLNRDQWAGPNAKLFLPFCGFVRADGATMTFPGSQIPQFAGPIISGVRQANSFTKYGCEPGICG